MSSKRKILPSSLKSYHESQLDYPVHETSIEVQEENNFSSVDTSINSIKDEDAASTPLNQNTQPKTPSPKSKFSLFLDENSEWLMKKDEDSKSGFRKVCRAIMIDKIINNLDSGEVKLLLKFRRKDNSWQEVTITRDMLESSKFINLLKYGVDIASKEKLKAAIAFLDLTEALSANESIHSSLGWGIYAGKKIFKHFNAIGCNSTYDGKLNIRPMGTLDGWLKLINEQVVGHTPLELALVLGLSAPVVSMLRRHTLVDVLLVHIFGDSTEGKTTATRLAVSPFGFPHTKDSGLIKTFSGTTNAVIGSLRLNFGIPLGLDESSIQSGKDFTSFIYTIVNGRDKDRMDANCELKSTAEFSTTVISNGEHSLLAKSNQNTGIKMRAIEFGSIQWTQSAANADALSDGLMKEYGTAGIEFVKYLRKFTESELVEMWEVWCDKCLEAMPKRDKFSPRIARKLAIVMLAAELAKSCLDLNLNLDGILTMLVEAELENIENRDIGENAYQYLKEEIFRLCKHFSKEDLHGDVLTEGFEQLGRIKHKGDRTQLLMTDTGLKKVLSSGGFEDVRIILKDWRDNKGYLECDDGKFKKRIDLDGFSNTRFHVINLVMPSAKDTKTDKQTARKQALEKKKNERKEIEEIFENLEESEGEV